MNTLQEYAEIFERLGLTELHAEDGEQKLTLKKEPEGAGISVQGCPIPQTMAFPQTTAVPQTTPIAQSAAENTQAAVQNAEQLRKGEIVKAPLLGIFHVRSGKPLAIGDRVSKGEALCTIEAMKMMNEVTSPCDGVVTEAAVAEGALVEYHQELFVIE